MGLIGIIVLALVIVAALFVAGLYNGLVRKRMLVREASSGIDVQLKRRYDLIPKIVDTVTGYTQYEKSLFERVTELRSQLVSGSQSPVEKAKAESELSGALKSVFALAEAYPALKASEGFLQLQNTLAEIEDQIQMARRYYNGSVRDYNVMTQQVPSNIIASLFKFAPEKFFELEYATERKAPDIKFS